MNLKAVLEGLLYIGGEEGLDEEKASIILGVDKDALKKLLEELTLDYDSAERGIKLESFGGRFKLVTKKEHA